MTTEAPNLDAQELFLRVWNTLGPASLMPVVFDEPKDDTVLPFGRGLVTVLNSVPYSGGQVNKIQVDVTCYIPQGASDRRLIEEKMSRMMKGGRALMGISNFKRARAKVDRTANRFAGRAVETWQNAWELWIDEDTTGN